MRVPTSANLGLELSPPANIEKSRPQGVMNKSREPLVTGKDPRIARDPYSPQCRSAKQGPNGLKPSKSARDSRTKNALVIGEPGMNDGGIAIKVE